MVDSLLRLHYAAADAVAATAAVRAVLGSARVTSQSGAVEWDQLSLVDDGITISNIHARGDSVRLFLPTASELVVIQVLAGEATLTTGGMQARLRADDLGLIPISAEAELRWSSVHLHLFSIPAAPLARLLGVPRTAIQLRAPRIDPCSPQLAEYFRRSAQLLTSDAFGTPDVYARDLVRVTAIESLTAVIVEAFELTNRSEDDSRRDSAVIRRAIKEMRDHLTEPVTIPEIADAAGVSIRGLQMAFRRHLDVAPLLHLRQIRLEAARSALVDEATAGTTIADIARRFGYANSGRFSTHYRNEYGEAPSATLQRIRGTETPASSPDDETVSEADLVQAEKRYGGGGGPGADGAVAIPVPLAAD